jgi:hypothetical protein
MAKFEAYAEYVTILRIEIEADTLEQAIEIAGDTDGGEWKPVDFDGWTVTEVFPLKGANHG